MALTLFSRTEFKTHAGISGTDHDTYIDELVVRLQSMVENFLGRPLEDSGSDVTEYYDGSGAPTLAVRRYPIVSITSIHLDHDRDWSSDTEVTSTEYVYDAAAGLVSILPVELVGKLTVASFVRGTQNVRVIYRGGYKDSGGTAVPEDMKEGALLWALSTFNRRASVGVSSFSSASLSYTFERGIPRDAAELLVPYKRNYAALGFGT